MAKSREVTVERSGSCRDTKHLLMSGVRSLTNKKFAIGNKPPALNPMITANHSRASRASRSRALAARRRALRDRCLISSVYSQCVMFECPRLLPLPPSTLFRRSP